MGSGKTTLGKSLATALHYRFFDLDDLIAVSSGKAVVKIFDESAEEGFREIERKILLDHLEDQDTVIATGGGTVCYKDNMDLMNSHGITIFMDTPLELIIERLKSETLHRPLLINISDDQLEDFIRKHLASRRIYYEKSKIRIEDDDLDILLDRLSSDG